MALSHSPRIVTDGLVLCLDAGNTKSYDRRENLVSYSTYNVATWAKIETTGTGTLTTGIDAPDGSSSAVRVTFNNDGNILLRVSFPAFTPNGTDTYTTSFYVRKISGTGAVSTDLSDGNPGGDYSSQLITGQWVRVVTSDIPTATSKSFIDLISDTNTNYVLDFWGLQIEKNTTATNYSATSGSTITRPTTWTDLSGNGNNGTLTNMDGANLDSANGGSLVFDGTNEYVQLSAITLLRASSTISSWINIDDFTTGKTSTGRVFIRNIGSNFNNLIAFYNGGYSFEVATNSNPHEISGRTTGNVSSSAISAGSWFHFSLVFDSDTFYGYVNGVQTGSASLNDNLTFNRIGDGSGFLDSYPAYMKGKISNFTVYNRALTASEIQQNFNALRSRFSI